MLPEWNPDCLGFAHERGHSNCVAFGLLECFDTNGVRLGELTRAQAVQAIGAPLRPKDKADATASRSA